MSTFSEDEKSRIYHYLGYPKQNALDQGLSSGYAISNAFTMQYLFDALNRISPEGETRIREDLAQLQCIDEQLIALRAQAGIEGLGDVKLNARAARLHLRQDRNVYVQRLGDDLGVRPNPGALQYSGRVVNT